MDLLFLMYLDLFGNVYFKLLLFLFKLCMFKEIKGVMWNELCVNCFLVKNYIL